jgi:hypothetical protein
VTWCSGDSDSGERCPARRRGSDGPSPCRRRTERDHGTGPQQRRVLRPCAHATAVACIAGGGALRRVRWAAEVMPRRLQRMGQQRTGLRTMRLQQALAAASPPPRTRPSHALLRREFPDPSHVRIPPPSSRSRPITRTFRPSRRRGPGGRRGAPRRRRFQCSLAAAARARHRRRLDPVTVGHARARAINHAPASPSSGRDGGQAGRQAETVSQTELDN